MSYNTLITRMYFLIAFADGNFDQKEILMGKQLVRSESLDENEFNVQLQLLKTRDRAQLLVESIEALKKLDLKLQVRVVAWMCVVANSDGFMDRTEWQMIYKIYHKELGLPLYEIFAVQKELNKLVWEKSSMIGL
jgi:tellurite resistance protein